MGPWHINGNVYGALRTAHTNHGAPTPTRSRFLRSFSPNQDTMSKGGSGNLIALPLQFAACPLNVPPVSHVIRRPALALTSED